METISGCFEPKIFIHYQRVVKGLLKDDLYNIHFQWEERASFSGPFLNFWNLGKSISKTYLLLAGNGCGKSIFQQPFHSSLIVNKDLSFEAAADCSGFRKSFITKGKIDFPQFWIWLLIWSLSVSPFTYVEILLFMVWQVVQPAQVPSAGKTGHFSCTFRHISPPQPPLQYFNIPSRVRFSK